MDELIERVKQSEGNKHTWRKDHNSVQWREANKLNKLLTKMPLNRRCNDCLDDLFFLLKRPSINDKIETEMKRQFQLKKAKLIMQHGCDQLSEHSTDEELISGLKHSPAIIKYFEYYPENWQEICGIEVKNEGVKEAAKTEGSEGSEGGSAEGSSDEIDFNDFTVKEIKKMLTDLKVDIPKKANKPVLIELLKANP